MKTNISIGNEQNAQQVLVIGVGGFGCKVAAKLNNQKHPDFTIVACDTDQRDLESVEVQNCLLLDSEQPGQFAQRVDKSLDYHNGDTACGQDYLAFAVQPFSQLMTDDVKSVIVVQEWVATAAPVPLSRWRKMPKQRAKRFLRLCQCRSVSRARCV